MSYERRGGILLHPTSLPGKFGIGDFGPEAYRFVDWLESANCRLWQVLPLNPPGFGNSPYACLSAFAGNPLLISPEMLFADGLITEADLNYPFASTARVNFGEVYPWKRELLHKAFHAAKANRKYWISVLQYRKQEETWLEPWAVFVACKQA
ncbi:MAG: 4-alpha-glucanotransferase, partial [bacterium]|nr:4-alpha-glucanotransferase [bacterium]